METDGDREINNMAYICWSACGVLRELGLDEIDFDGEVNAVI